MIKEISFFSSQKQELINITSKVKEVIFNSGVKNGFLILYVPHATAALWVNEDEKGLKEDALEFFASLVPSKNYKHNQIDDNASAHLLSGILGESKVFIIKDGEILRGTWQEIFLVELDGPRANREVMIKIVED